MSLCATAAVAEQRRRTHAQRELYEKYGILKDVMVHPSAQKFIRILEKISQVRIATDVRPLPGRARFL